MYRGQSCILVIVNTNLVIVNTFASAMIDLDTYRGQSCILVTVNTNLVTVNTNLVIVNTFAFLL